MASGPPLRLLRLGNPVVRAVLRSPLHPLLSGSLVLLEYTGRRSGRRFAIPVMAAETPDGLVALAVRPDRKRWWRAFRDPTPARLRVRGAWREAEGRVLVGDARRRALRAYLRRFPRASRALGTATDAPDGALDAADAAVVAFVRRV